jgi:hypothetical protein
MVEASIPYCQNRCSCALLQFIIYILYIIRNLFSAPSSNGVSNIEKPNQSAKSGVSDVCLSPCISADKEVASGWYLELEHYKLKMRP